MGEDEGRESDHRHSAERDGAEAACVLSSAGLHARRFPDLRRDGSPLRRGDSAPRLQVQRPDAHPRESARHAVRVLSDDSLPARRGGAGRRQSVPAHEGRALAGHHREGVRGTVARHRTCLVRVARCGAVPVRGALFCACAGYQMVAAAARWPGARAERARRAVERGSAPREERPRRMSSFKLGFHVWSRVDFHLDVSLSYERYPHGGCEFGCLIFDLDLH